LLIKIKIKEKINPTKNSQKPGHMARVKGQSESPVPCYTLSSVHIKQESLKTGKKYCSLNGSV